MSWPTLEATYAPPTAALASARPVWPIAAPNEAAILTTAQRDWLAAHRFGPGKVMAVPDGNGAVAGLAVGVDSRAAHSSACVSVGHAASLAPEGDWHLASPWPRAELATIAWGLGAYRFRRYKTAGDRPPRTRLHVPPNVLASRVQAIVEGVHFGRDLINTPANDMGPDDLEAAVRLLAERHGAAVSVITGSALLERNFPLIHMVGRASPRAPRLIDLTWGREGPRVTLVGKGICFDTGGLDLKTASGMLLMKKDMGGAASVLALGHMLMATGQRMRLRILIAAADNAIGGAAFRPGDVVASRAGLTVEIGNTDAEGRLVLADALALADADAPDTLITMATLTGAARTAVGPELVPYFCDDDGFAVRLEQAGLAVVDPVWRLPFWGGYENLLDSSVGDLGNVSDTPYAGAIVAALFLRRFVRQARRYVHFDIFGWRPNARPLGPRGGEVNAARTLFEVLRHGAA
jgi:leucyl aminopeptidase